MVVIYEGVAIGGLAEFSVGEGGHDVAKMVCDFVVPHSFGAVIALGWWGVFFHRAIFSQTGN